MSHEEYAVARALAREGHQVVALRESRGQGPRADLEACGGPVEVKSWLPGTDRRRPPTSQSVFNKLLDGSRQAPTVVLYAKGSGLGRETAAAGLARYARRFGTGPLTAVRVIGDDFDLAWRRSPAPEIRGRPLGQAARDRAGGVGL